MAQTTRTGPGHSVELHINLHSIRIASLCSPMPIGSTSSNSEENSGALQVGQLVCALALAFNHLAMLSYVSPSLEWI